MFWGSLQHFTNFMLTQIQVLLLVIPASKNFFCRFLKAYLNRSVTINGLSITVVDLAPLTTKLKAHFNCNDLEGAYIEQQGGSGSAGSHFERRIFMNEV